jgi:hypothetical protein
MREQDVESSGSIPNSANAEIGESRRLQGHFLALRDVTLSSVGPRDRPI